MLDSWLADPAALTRELSTRLSTFCTMEGGEESLGRFLSKEESACVRRFPFPGQGLHHSHLQAVAGPASREVEDTLVAREMEDTLVARDYFQARSSTVGCLGEGSFRRSVTTY